jgi:hypothetical protein
VFEGTYFFEHENNYEIFCFPEYQVVAFFFLEIFDDQLKKHKYGLFFFRSMLYDDAWGLEVAGGEN